MSFSRVDVKERYFPEHERKQLMDLVEYKFSKPKMSRKRVISTFMSISAGLFALYCSLLYIPAFYDIGKALGLSTEDVKLPEIDTEHQHALSPYLDKVKLRRGYMSAGQAIEVKYVLSPGDKVELKVEKCSSPVIIEVFYCASRQGRETTIEQPRGTRSFAIREAGFYYFYERVLNQSGQETSKPFTVMWKRNRNHREMVIRQLR